MKRIEPDQSLPIADPALIESQGRLYSHPARAGLLCAIRSEPAPPRARQDSTSASYLALMAAPRRRSHEGWGRSDPVEAPYCCERSIAEVRQDTCNDLVALVRGVSVHFTGGKIAYYRLQTIWAVERVVDIRASEAVRLRRLADHRIPCVKDGTRCLRGFGRDVAAIPVLPPDPVVVRVGCPEDGWLPGSQGNDLGEDALEPRAEELRRRGRTGRVELRPVWIVVSRTVARVIVSVPGRIVAADADDNDVRIGECLAPFDVGLCAFGRFIGWYPPRRGRSAAPKQRT